METIVILKKDLKYYFFINYIIKNTPDKSINIILNDIVSDDIGDIVENRSRQLRWIPVNVVEIKSKDLIIVSKQLYLSKGLSEFIEIFKDNQLLLNFNKLICVQDYKKLTCRISYI